MPNSDSKGEVFVRIPEQLELRTSLLESARLSTFLLKKYDRISQINKEKKKESARLKLLCSEAKSLLSTMEFKDVSWFDSKEEVKEKTVTKVKKEEKIQIQKDKLSQDLEEIERKLNSLKF